MYDKQIDRFTSAVTRDMNGKQRDEVKRELRAHILDSAEALAAERKVPVDDSIVGEVIARMGPPGEIAAEYPQSRKPIVSDRLILGCFAIIVVLAVLLAAVGGAYGLLWALAPAEHREDITSHPGAAKINLAVDTFGNVNVVESGTGDVQVTYTVRARHGHLNDTVTSTTYSLDGDTLTVKSEATHTNTLGGIISLGDTGGVDVLIKVPKNSQYDLNLKTSYGSITLTALNGSRAVLGSDSGNVVIKGGQYDDLTATSDYGSITAKYEANTSTFTSGSGNLVLDSSGPANSLTASTSYGAINARYNAARATFKSGSGNLDLASEGEADSLAATTSYGAIKAKYNASRAEFRSGSGNLNLDSAGPAESLIAATDYGSITARYNARIATFDSASGNLDLSSAQPADSLVATTDYGAIKAKYNATQATFKSGSGNLDLDSAQTSGSLGASSDYGYVHVTLPAGLPFSVDASTSYGKIKHDTIPLVMTEAGDNHLIGYTQGGQGVLNLKLHSGSGSVEISY